MQKNKAVLIGGFIVALCIAILVIFSFHPDKGSDPDPKTNSGTQLAEPTSLQEVKLAQSQASAMAKIAQIRGGSTSEDPMLTKVETETLEELTENKRIEIEQATLDYNNSALDEAERKLIKLRIQHLMDEYNQLLLPLAITKMAQTTNAE